jgi:hypothetical protein
LAGDLNAKNPFWNGAVSNPSLEKLLYLFDVNQFEISAPYFSTNYSPARNGDVHYTLIHRNIRVSDNIVSDILNSDSLSIIFHTLDHIKIRNFSEFIEKITDLERL